MSVLVNVNGRIADGETAAISVFDHGFLYGEGVYETIRTYNGEPFLFDRHMKRLRTSAAMILLDVPLSDAEYLDAIGRDDERGRARQKARWQRRRGLHPHPSHARHRRYDLRSRPPLPGPRS